MQSPVRAASESPRADTGASLDPAPVRPTYRFDQSFEWNYDHGPDFNGPWPQVPVTPMKSFFGYPVRSRFGVAASILPNSRWIDTYARLGFDLLTYKTVRSLPRLCGTPPNWIYLDETSLAPALADPNGAVMIAERDPRVAIGTTTGGSFGMPSRHPDVWREDIARARTLIGAGQVLIVSVVGSAVPDITEEAFIADFAQCARWASAAGAQIIEANFSCPNVGKAEGQLFLNVELAGRIAKAVKQATSDKPLLLKIGAINDAERLAAFCKTVAGAADGLVMVNAPARRVVGRDGQPYFGAGRERAGVTGAAIMTMSLNAARAGIDTIDRLKLPLQVIGCGGITTVDDVRAFIDAGACAAVSSTAATFNPYLACEVKARADAV